MGQSSVWNGLRPYTGNLRRLLRSTSNGRLLAESIEFARSHAQILVLGATRAAADELAFRIGTAAGMHRLTTLQLAADLARPAMADRQLGPLAALGQEALAALVVHTPLEAVA